MIPVDVAQDDPIHIIRRQGPLREALDYVMVTAYWVSRFNVFSNRCGVGGERVAESEVEEETGGRWIIVCGSGGRGMLY